MQYIIILNIVLCLCFCSCDTAEEDSNLSRVDLIVKQEPYFKDTMRAKYMNWVSNDHFVPGDFAAPAMDLSNCECYDTLIINEGLGVYYHSFSYDFNAINYDTIVKDRDYGTFQIFRNQLLFNQDTTQCFYVDSIYISSDIYGDFKSRFTKNCHPGSSLIVQFPSKYGLFEYYFEQ